MASHTIPTVRTSDATLLEFYETLEKAHSFQALQFRIVGSDTPLNTQHPLIPKIRSANAYSIWQATATKNNNCGITYTRNVDPNRFAKPDQIVFTNNNNAVDIDEAFRLDELIGKQFLGALPQPAALQFDETAFSSVVASHQEIVIRLEQSLELISRKFTEERLKLQSEQADFLRQKGEDAANLEKRIRDSYEQKEAALTAKQKTLDDRDNMHARRAIRADMKSRLGEHAKRFTLTDETRRLRWPLHITVWLFLALFSLGVGFAWWKMSENSSIDYSLLGKSTLLTIAALGILAWYIRWMNRWFDQHADAEFYLKQFELDVDRASWVVETAMEWRASQHGVIPTALLESISRNLFVRVERQRDEELHPADYLASALLGNASHARIKLGDAELDYNRGALKKAATAAEKT
jgi:hypothetical protein